ncbi:LOW QUALITY PROTEIN: protein disulfide-isomerase-like protein of the testis, partial [Phaethornis superciliosus]
FFLPLLFLTGFLAANSISPNEIKPKKAKLPKIKKEKNVLLLKKTNFDTALNETKYLLVEFYILHLSSQNLSEECAEAGQLKNEAPRIHFGKSDVTHQHDLRKEFNICEFPTVKFFVDGGREDSTDCKVKLSYALIAVVRPTSSFITRVKRRTGPSTFISSTDPAEAIIHAGNLTVIGFFKELHNDSMEVFCGTARDVPVPFGMTASKDVCANYSIQKNTLVFQKKGKPVHNEVLEGQKKLDLTRLIEGFTLDLVTEYNLETSVKISDVPVENHILLFTPRNSETSSVIYENYSGEFRGKVSFVLVDRNETRNGVLEYFHIRDIDVPTVRTLNLTSDAKYKTPADEVTVENLKDFCHNYLHGKAKVQLSSEKIPDWDKMPVKVLVGKNFMIAFNNTMTVFVMFYGPWSNNRKLLPVWDKLGEQFESHEDILIAKVDVTANDILSVGDRYPFFRLFPAGPDEQDPLGGIKENLSKKEIEVTEKGEL